MFRRDIARQLGGFREDLEVSVDYEFFTRLVQRGRIVILPFVGSKYRLHDQQSSIRRRDVQRRNGLMISRQMLSRFLGRCLSDEEFCAVASIWMRLGQRDMAAAGHRMLRETYARFASTQVNHRHLRRVRRITATQWFFSAITFVKLRALREAAHNVYYAMLWDPAILGIGALHLIDRTWVRLRRAAIGTTVGSHF
jgi:hypothetical protein